MSQSGALNVSASGLPVTVPTSFQTNAGVAVPVMNILNILGAGGATTSGLGNTVTISISATGLTWNTISASQTLAINSGYFCISPGGALSLLLPAVSSVGDTVEVSLDGATSFTITQGAGQQIRLGNLATTAGVGGTLGSTQQGDSLRMVCSIANLKWNVLSVEGNVTIV